MSYGHDVVYQYCIDCFMYFHHVAGVVAQLETQAGLFLENQKPFGQPQVGRAESDRSGMEGLENRERPFWAAYIAGQAIN